MKQSEGPVVSVCLITYNHKKFISAAIESVLQQQADFLWDIYIADDCSTDGTTEIVKAYGAKYPDKIKLILQPQNVGLNQNFIDLFTAPNSTYIAFLDGDDVWTDPYRLQKQVNFLNQHPDYVMVYGKYTLMDELGNEKPYRKLPPYKSGYIFKDIILCRFLPHMASALMRTSEIKKLYPEKKGIGVDFYLVASLCKNKQAAYMNENFFCYRINSGSITNVQRFNTSNLFLKIMEGFEKEYPALVKKGIQNGKQIMLYHYAEKEPGMKAIGLLLKHFRFSGMYFRQLVKCVLNTITFKRKQGS